MYRWLTSHDSRAQSFLILCYAMNAFELLDAELPFPRCDVRFSVDKLLECFFPFDRMNEPFSVSINKLNMKQIPASRDILFAYCPNHWTETFSSYISWSMLSFENRSEKNHRIDQLAFCGIDSLVAVTCEYLPLVKMAVISIIFFCADLPGYSHKYDQCSPLCVRGIESQTNSEVQSP